MQQVFPLQLGEYIPTPSKTIATVNIVTPGGIQDQDRVNAHFSSMLFAKVRVHTERLTHPDRPCAEVITPRTK